MTVAPTDASAGCGQPARALLDFYVNGSLEGDEAATVSGHVGQCDACAREVRELQDLATAIEAHGTEPVSRWRSIPRRWGWIAAAAAVLVAGLVLLQREHRQPFPTQAPPAGNQKDDAAGAEVFLDLGAGVLRDDGRPLPAADITGATTSLALTLWPPVAAPGTLLVSVRDAEDRAVVEEIPLPPLDAMGRAAFSVPASAFTSSGTYDVRLRSAAADGGEPSSYPFRLRVAGRGN